MKLLFDDGDEHVGGHGAPHLCLHGVLAVAQEKFKSAPNEIGLQPAPMLDFRLGVVHSTGQ